MGTGIIVCGLNGAGKSTLGKALAEKLNFYFIDNEDLYFPKTGPDYIYSSPRSCEDAAELLSREIQSHENFVFSAVKGDYGKSVSFQYAVILDVPKDIRMQRVRDRSFKKFGNRILPGGDLHEKEENFFELVRSRPENLVEEWVQSLNCPVIRADGTEPVDKNIKLITDIILKSLS